MARTKQTARTKKPTNVPLPPQAPPPPPPQQLQGRSKMLPKKPKFGKSGIASNATPSYEQQVAGSLLEKIGVEQKLVVKPNPLDLLSAKSKLKPAKANYKPIKANRRKLFDNKEYHDLLMDWNKDYFPLQGSLQKLQMDLITGDLIEIDLAGVDQLTDAFFYMLERSGSNFKKVNTLSLTGCVHVTDAGVQSLCTVFGNLHNAKFNGCRALTEKSLYYLLKANSKEANLTTVFMESTNVGLIPAINAEAMSSLKLNGCPLISPSLEDYLAVGKVYFDEGRPGNFILNAYKMVVINIHLRKFSVCHFLKTGERKGTTDRICTYQQTSDLSSGANYNIVEMDDVEPYLDTFISEGCLVVIPCSNYDVESYEAKRVSSTVLHALNVSTQIYIAIVPVNTAPSITVKLGLSMHIDNKIKSDASTLRDHVEDDLQRNYRKASMNFKMQKTWCRAEEKIHGLESFVGENRLLTPDEKFEDVFKKLPHLTPWQEKFGPSIKDLLDAESQKMTEAPFVRRIETVIETEIEKEHTRRSSWYSNSQAHDETSSQIDKLSSRQLKKGLEILSQRGFCLFFGDVRRMPCVTNLELFKEVLLLVQNPSQVTGPGMRVTAIGNGCGCWTHEGLKEALSKLLRDFTTKTDKIAVLDDKSITEQVHDLVSILLKRHVIIELPCDRDSVHDQLSLYFTYNDLPMYPPDLEELWSTDRMPGEIQVERFYTFTHGMPQTFLPALFRRFARILPVQRLWQYGLLIQSGGTDALIEYNMLNEDTPVISVGVRAFDPEKSLPYYTESQVARAKEARETTLEAMWSLLNLCCTLLDYLLVKQNVYAWIELVCPECDIRQSTRSALMDNDINKIPLHKMLLAHDRRLMCREGVCIRIKKKTHLSKKLMLGPDHQRLAPAHDMALIQECKKHEAFKSFSKCFLCNNCVEKGIQCQYNKLNGKTSRDCACDTDLVLCPSCGICPKCTAYIAKLETTLEPGLSSAVPFDFSQETSDNYLTGNIMFSTGGIMVAKQPMTPELFSYFDMTSLRGNHFHLLLIKGFSRINHSNPMEGCVASFDCSQGLLEVNEDLGPQKKWILRQGNSVGFRLRYAKQNNMYKPPLLALDLVLNGEVVHSSSSWVPQGGYTPLYPLIHVTKPVSAIIYAPCIWSTKKQVGQKKWTSKFSRDELVEYEGPDNSLQLYRTLDDNTAVPMGSDNEKDSVNITAENVHPVGFHKLKGKVLNIKLKNAEEGTYVMHKCSDDDPVLDSIIERWKLAEWKQFHQLSATGGVPYKATATHVRERLAQDCSGFLLGHAALYCNAMQDMPEVRELLFTNTGRQVRSPAVALLPKEITTDLIFDGDYRSERSRHNASVRAGNDPSPGFTPIGRLPYAACSKSVHALCAVNGPAYDTHVLGDLADGQDQKYWDVHLLNDPGLKIPSLGTKLMDLMYAWHMMLSTSPKILLPTQYEKIFPNMSSVAECDAIESWLQRCVEHQVHLGLLRQPPQMTLSELLKQNDRVNQSGQPHLRSMDELWQEAIYPKIEEEKLSLKRYNVLMGFDQSFYVCPTHGESCVRKVANSPEESIGEAIANNDFSRQVNLYSKFVKSLVLINQDIIELPSDFFDWFPLLIDLDLSDNKLTALPDSIGSSKQLFILTVPHNNLTGLPHTLAQCTTLARADLSHNPVQEFPPVLLQLCQVRKIFVKGTLIQKLPEFNNNWERIEVLALSHTLISQVPESLAKLKTLEIFHMDGVPWIQKTEILAEKQFKDYVEKFSLENHFDVNWHDQRKPAIDKMVTAAFKGNKLLVEDEVTQFSSGLFKGFPRLGLSNGPGSSFPMALLELENLTSLYLSYQAIRSIPAAIGRLKKLTSLNVNHCILLETLPGSLGNLTLKQLSLENCPSLRTPPQEILAQGTRAVMAYLRRLQKGSVTCNRTKLMFVGLGGAGKTSLAKAFTRDDDKAHLVAGEEITDGIDISTWMLRRGQKEVEFSVWDFAGQTIYYNTHQFFLSNRAVYLLLWNIRLGYEHAGLDFWLSSISVHAPKAPVFVVGTHCDQVRKWDLPIEEMRKRYPQIAGFHFVSSFTGDGVADLKENLLDTASQESYMGESIPEAWLTFENAVIQERSKEKVLTLAAVKTLAANSGVFDNSEVQQSLQFLHELGALQHFNNEFLKNHVVIDPQWIVDVMACVVSVKDSPIVAGKFHHRDLGKVWRNYPSSLHQWLLRLTEEYDLTFPLPDKKINLVPCLLPATQPTFDWPEPKQGERETKMLYKFAYLPPGLFNRAQVRLYQYCDSSFIWRRGSLLSKNQHAVLIKQLKNSEVIVRAVGPRPENALFLVHEVFEALISESFRGVHYDFQVPCPDCCSAGLAEPFMFSAAIVDKATAQQAPFIQCTESFHNVAISDLHSIMPPDSSKEYDVHLATAVRGLADLKHQIRPDLFISYCVDDLSAAEKDDHKISPKKIYAELKRKGFKCYFPDKTSSQHLEKQAIAMRDAKALVALVSDSYVAHAQCVNMLQYALNSLHKPLVMVALGTMWRETKIGILLSDVVYVNMVQSERYAHKVPELLQMAEEKSADTAQKANFPPCFISYSWANSHMAAKTKTTQCETLGEVDPRQIKDYLDKHGIDCWIDVERVGKKGLFEDIGDGLRHAKVMVACVSDEYALSENCLMELRFASNVMKLPTILAVVGTGNNWRRSTAGMIALKHNLPEINFQTASDVSNNNLLDFVKSHVPVEKESSKEQAVSKEEPLSNEKDTEEKENVSFQEMYELAQRKFLRQLAQYSESLDIIYPRLVIVDFLHMIQSTEEDHKSETSSRPSSGRPTLQHRASHTRPRLLPHLLQQGLGFKLLCEHEAGWHSCSDPISASDSLDEKALVAFSPYLARITALLRNSQKLHLNMADGGDGEQFVHWLEDLPEVEKSEFGECYNELRMLAQKADKENKMGELVRCHLPSGKTMWLCPEHSKMERVTILTNDDIVTNPVSSLRNIDEDMLKYLDKNEEAENQQSTGDLDPKTACEEDGVVHNEQQLKIGEMMKFAAEVIPQRPLKPDRSGYQPDEKDMALVPIDFTRKTPVTHQQQQQQQQRAVTNVQHQQQQQQQRAFTNVVSQNQFVPDDDLFSEDNNDDDSYGYDDDKDDPLQVYEQSVIDASNQLFDPEESIPSSPEDIADASHEIPTLDEINQVLKEKNEEEEEEEEEEQEDGSSVSSPRAARVYSVASSFVSSRRASHFSLDSPESDSSSRRFSSRSESICSLAYRSRTGQYTPRSPIYQEVSETNNSVDPPQFVFGGNTQSKDPRNDSTEAFNPFSGIGSNIAKFGNTTWQEPGRPFRFGDITQNRENDLFAHWNPPRPGLTFGRIFKKETSANPIPGRLPATNTYLSYEEKSKPHKRNAKSAHSSILRVREETKTNFEKDKSREQLKAQAQAVVKAAGALSSESELCRLM